MATITTIMSREFNQDIASAKKAAALQPELPRARVMARPAEID